MTEKKVATMRLVDVDKIEPHEQLESLGNGQYEYVRVAYMDDIDVLPTVDAVPVRHGKWVDENGNRPYGYRFNWLCSECGRPQHTPTAKLLKEFEEEHRWCHFCGIRMDGKDGDGNG